MVSISTYPKMVKLLGAGEKTEISNFIDLFCLKKTQFFFCGGDWIRNQESVFPQIFHGPSVSEHETAVSIF